MRRGAANYGFGLPRGRSTDVPDVTEALAFDTSFAETGFLDLLAQLKRVQNSSMEGRSWPLLTSPPATARWVTVWLAIRYLLLWASSISAKV
jgi:hypothetical protein